MHGVAGRGELPRDGGGAISPSRAWVIALFALSGAAGLVYEVVWQRQFTRVFGITQHATAAVLAGFMAGLALGSYLFGRAADRPGARLLRWYGLLELAVGLCGFAVPAVLLRCVPLYRELSVFFGTNSFALLAAKTALLAGIILVPTTLMGGTLPLLTVLLTRRGGDSARSLSLLYAWNTFGAVAGVLAAAFLLLGSFGERDTLSAAVATNFAVGLAALALSARSPSPAGEPTRRSEIVEEGAGCDGPAGRRWILPLLAASGFAALAYEVVWSRELVLILATSVYAFAAMLAIFLAGLAIGSRTMHALLPRVGSPLALFAGLQAWLALWTLASARLFLVLGARQMHLLPDLGSVAVSVALLLPLAVALGAILPCAMRVYSRSGEVGAGLGRLYAANTIGNVAGALATGLVLLPRLGAYRTLVMLAVASSATGAVAIAASGAAARVRGAIALLLAGGVAAAAVATATGDPFLTLVERKVAGYSNNDYLMFGNLDGVEGTVTAFQRAPGMKDPREKQLWINGIGMTYIGPETRLMAHLPLALADQPRRLLVVCFGMGTVVRSAFLHPELEITAVELVRELYDLFPFFVPDGAAVLGSGRVRPVVGDGRNVLLVSRETYDAIIVDPAPPIFSAGAANLYTKEFLELARRHLTPGGVMLLWIPQGTRLEMLGIAKTFLETFPNTHVWSGPNFWGVYLVGLPDGRTYDRSVLDRAFAENPSFVADVRAVARYGWRPADAGDLHLWGPQELARRTTDVPTLTDDDPYTEFPLGRERDTVVFSDVAALRARRLPHAKPESRAPEKSP